MNVDFELYRREVRVSTNPLVRLCPLILLPICRAGQLFFYMALAGGPAGGFHHLQHARTPPSQRRLPPALVPKRVIFADDFPRRFLGKVLRRELAKRIEPQVVFTAGGFVQLC